MTAEKMMALLPCPFCGSGTVGFTYIRDGHSACCRVCMASVRAFEPNAKAEAAKLWNTRASAVGAGAREAMTEDALTAFLCDVQDRIGPGCDERAIAQALLSTYALQAEPVQPAGVRAVLDQVEAKAREWAGHYKPHSDGWNTFILFAEWVETLPDPVRRSTQPIQRDSTARLDSGEVRPEPGVG